LPGDRRAREQGPDPGQHLRRAVAVAHDGGERPANLVERRGNGVQPVQARARVGDDGGQALVDLVRDRGGELAQGGHAGHARELGLGLVQGVLGMLALGDVVVRLEDRRDPIGSAAPQRPAAGHHDRGPVAARVDELAFPAPGPGQLGHDVGQRSREDGPHAGVGHRADRLRFRPAVELLRAAVPVGDDVLPIADEDGVVGQIEQRGLIAEGLFHPGPRCDLGLQPGVAVGEVRGPRLDAELQLVPRVPERVLGPSAAGAEPADQEGGEREDRDAQEKIEVERDRGA